MAKRGGFPGGMGMPGNMNNLMKQAQRMQRQMEEGQKELEVKEFSAKSGGGAVEAVVNGKKELVKLTISEEAVDPEDVEMLQDMIVAAVNEAMKQADEASQELMGKMTGGLGGAVVSPSRLELVAIMTSFTSGSLLRRSISSFNLISWGPTPSIGEIAPCST